MGIVSRLRGNRTASCLKCTGFKPSMGFVNLYKKFTLKTTGSNWLIFPFNWLISPQNRLISPNIWLILLWIGSWRGIPTNFLWDLESNSTWLFKSFPQECSAWAGFQVFFKSECGIKLQCYRQVVSRRWNQPFCMTPEPILQICRSTFIKITILTFQDIDILHVWKIKNGFQNGNRFLTEIFSGLRPP